MTEAVIVVAALLVRGDRFLVTQRPADCPMYPSRWELPGGKVEPGEEDPDALAREIREELDLSVQVGRCFAQLFEALPDGRRLDFRVYLCRAPTGEPRAVEVQDLRWIHVAQAADLPMPPVDVTIMKRIAQQGLE